jgi:hypothetical protein
VALRNHLTLRSNRTGSLAPVDISVTTPASSRFLVS